jgi:hypothetical protein
MSVSAGSPLQKSSKHVTSPPQNGNNKSELILSQTPGGYGAQSAFQRSLGRAAQEYIYLKVLIFVLFFFLLMCIKTQTVIDPMLLLSAFVAPENATIVSQASELQGNTSSYPSSEELLSATKIYVECFKRDRNIL